MFTVESLHSIIFRHIHKDYTAAVSSLVVFITCTVGGVKARDDGKGKEEKKSSSLPFSLFITTRFPRVMKTTGQDSDRVDFR